MVEEWNDQDSPPEKAGKYAVSYPKGHPMHGEVALLGEPAYWNGGKWYFTIDGEVTNEPLLEQRRPWRNLEA